MPAEPGAFAAKSEWGLGLLFRLQPHTASPQHRGGPLLCAGVEGGPGTLSSSKVLTSGFFPGASQAPERGKRPPVSWETFLGAAKSAAAFVLEPSGAQVRTAMLRRLGWGDPIASQQTSQKHLLDISELSVEPPINPEGGSQGRAGQGRVGIRFVAIKLLSRKKHWRSAAQAQVS